MNLPIKWTPLALQSLSDVFEYTCDIFGEQQLHKLRGKVSDATRLLSLFPLAGKKEIELSEDLKTDYRSIVVIKEIKLIYTVTYDEVFIEYVMNTRQSEATVANLLELTNGQE